MREISQIVKTDFVTAIGSRINVPMTKYIEARLDIVKHELTTADEKLVKNLQGRAQELQHILDMLTKARESA